MKSARNSFGLFILIFSVYWISDAVTYYFFKNTDDLVIKFVIITAIAFVIIAIYNFDNRRMEKKMQEILEKSNKQILNTTNKILSSHSIPINKRLQDTSELIKNEFNLQEVFISLKKLNYLDIINMTPNLEALLTDSRISLKINRNPIKELIASEFVRKEHIYDFKNIKKEINGVYIQEVLNIPILSKFSKGNLGVITLIIPKDYENRDELRSQLIVVSENVALNIFMDMQNSKRLSINNIQNSNHSESINIASEIKHEYENRHDLTAICVDLINIINHKKIQTTESPIFQTKKSILSLIRNLIRDIEVTTLFNKNKLFIILPKSEVLGSSILINRLLEKINDLKAEGLDIKFGITELNTINDKNRMEIIKKLENIIA